MIQSTEHIMPIAMTATEQGEILNTINLFGPTAKFTEWGSGGSTVLWYTNLGPEQQLISIENDPEWAGRVQGVIDDLEPKKNFTYLVYPTPFDGATFTPEAEHYTDYVAADDRVWDSDVFLVDGRVRLWCARTIAKRAKPTAVVYCHDYAHNAGSWDQIRPYYARHEIIKTPGTEYMMLKLWVK